MMRPCMMMRPPRPANFERLDGKSHVQSTEDTDTLDQHVSDHDKNVKQARRTASLSKSIGPWS